MSKMVSRTRKDSVHVEGRPGDLVVYRVYNVIRIVFDFISLPTVLYTHTHTHTYIYIYIYIYIY